jgi:hypothetical protein
MEVSAFQNERTPIIEGDRFITFRGSDENDQNDIAE